MAEERGRFLPPQAPGPEPELGSVTPRFEPPARASAPAAWAPPSVQTTEPDNGPAVAGFVLSVVSGGLLVVTAGLSTVVSITCAILGLLYSRRGKRKVERGETRRNAGLAKAGFVISIVSLVLAALATLAYAAFLVLYLTDDSFRDDVDGSDGSALSMSGLRVAVLAGRALLA